MQQALPRDHRQCYCHSVAFNCDRCVSGAGHDLYLNQPQLALKLASIGSSECFAGCLDRLVVGDRHFNCLIVVKENARQMFAHVFKVLLVVAVWFSFGVES